MKSPPIVTVVALLAASVASAEPIKGFGVASNGSCHIEWDGVTGRVFFVQTSTDLCAGWSKAYGARGAPEMSYTHPSTIHSAVFFSITSREERVSEFDTVVPLDFHNITVSNIGFTAYVENLLPQVLPEWRDYVRAHLADFGIVSNGLDIAVFSGAWTAGEAGQPSLPYVTVGFLLPPNADLSARTAVLVEDTVEDVPGEWDVLPEPPPASGTNLLWPSGVEIVDGRDVAAYSTNAFMPASSLVTFTTGHAREWKLGDVRIFPYRYNPVTKRLRRIVQGRLVVTYDRIYGMVKGSSVNPGMAAMFRQMAHDHSVNFDDVVGEYDDYDRW